MGVRGQGGRSVSEKAIYRQLSANCPALLPEVLTCNRDRHHRNLRVMGVEWLRFALPSPIHCSLCPLIFVRRVGADPYGAVKHALRSLALAVCGALLLAAVHSHVREHQVPHPSTTKVSITKCIVPRPQLAVVPHAAIPATATERLIAIELVATPGAGTLLEITQRYYRVRGPPSQNRWNQGVTSAHIR